MKWVQKSNLFIFMVEFNSDWQSHSVIHAFEGIWKSGCFIKDEESLLKIIRGAVLQKERRIDGVYTNVLRGEACECAAGDILGSREGKLPR